MKTKKINNNRNIFAILAAFLVLIVAIIGVVEIPKAISKNENAAEAVRFEEIDSFAISKMEMATYIEDDNIVHNYYATFEGKHVVFMAEINLEQYIYYGVGDVIPGTLIVENEDMVFEFDEFGKSFSVLGYVGLTDE